MGAPPTRRARLRVWCRGQAAPVLRRYLGSVTAFVGLGLLIGLPIGVIVCVAPLWRKLLPLIVCFFVVFSRRGLSFIATMTVEHLYSLGLGKMHLWLHTKTASAPYHSRFVDLRVDVQLAGGGSASVHLVPLLADNYAYLVVDRSSRPAPFPACIIDPCDAPAVFDALPAIQEVHYGGQRLDLQAILTTHKHWDHQGGNLDLPALIPSIRKIYGGAQERVLGCTDDVTHGEVFRVGGLEWTALSVPGHTRGSMAYVLNGAGGRHCVMTGDALFCGGSCGAPFEQCEGESHRNMLTLLHHCGPRSLLFPGHEYTTTCLEAACHALMQKAEADPKASPSDVMAAAAAFFASAHRRAQKEHNEKLPTVPICLEEERRIGSVLWDPLLKSAETLFAILATRENQLSDLQAVGDGAADPSGGDEFLSQELDHEEQPREPSTELRPPVEVEMSARLRATSGCPRPAEAASDAPSAERPRAASGRPAVSETADEASRFVLTLSHSSGSSSHAEREGGAEELPSELEVPLRERAVPGAQGAGGLDEAYPRAQCMSIEPLVLPPSVTPCAVPLVAIYRADVDEICAELASGRLSGVEAAVRLENAHRRGLVPPLGRQTPMRFVKAPERAELIQLLRIFAVAPDISIGRETADLSLLTVCKKHLVCNIGRVCGGSKGASMRRIVNNVRQGVAIDDMADFLVDPLANPAKVLIINNHINPEAAALPPSPPPTPRMATLLAPAALAPVAVPANGLSAAPARPARCPAPVWAFVCCAWRLLQTTCGSAASRCPCLCGCFVGWCGRWQRRIRRLCCEARKRVPVADLLVRPKHDALRCRVCSGLWRGRPAEKARKAHYPSVLDCDGHTWPRGAESGGELRHRTGAAANAEQRWSQTAHPERHIGADLSSVDPPDVSLAAPLLL